MIFTLSLSLSKNTHKNTYVNYILMDMLQRNSFEDKKKNCSISETMKISKFFILIDCNNVSISISTCDWLACVDSKMRYIPFHLGLSVIIFEHFCTWQPISINPIQSIIWYMMGVEFSILHWFIFDSQNEKQLFCLVSKWFWVEATHCRDNNCYDCEFIFDFRSFFSNSK